MHLDGSDGEGRWFIASCAEGSATHMRQRTACDSSADPGSPGKCSAGECEPGSNNYVDQGGGQNQYKEHEAAYVVFVTEATDRRSLNRRMMEVNAVMPAVPRFMQWMDQVITWS